MPRLVPSVAFSVLTALLLPGAPAMAADDGASARSAYSSIAAKQCRKTVDLKIDGVDYASSDLCAGVGGLKVLRQEDDLRETISVGRSAAAAARQPAASQGFGPFNSTTDTIEWRLDRAGKPFAIIQRWHIADNDDPDKDGRPRTKSLLIVTRLPPGAVCHIAYIDGIANPDANDLARKAADETARGFDCAKDKVQTFGQSGRAIELALRR
jgi:hypothetical protein